MLTFIVTILIGMVAGLLSGLLGIGGGVVIVPALNAFFEWQHFPENLHMHLAIGTSLCAMMMTTGAVVFAHQKKRTIYWSFLKYLIPGTMLGAIIGISITKHLKTTQLETLFGFFCIILSIYLFFKKVTEDASKKTVKLNPYLLFSVAVVVGLSAGILGIGGGIILIPILMHLGLPIRQAMATSITAAFATATMGTVMAIVAGWNHPHLPLHAFGYVYLPIAMVLGLASMLGAPLGVKLVHFLPVKWIQYFFAILLLGVAIKMLYV